MERGHGRLWKMYQADVDINARRISAMGNQMKKAREDADYVSSIPRIADVMVQQISDASAFVALLAQVPTTSPRLLPPNSKQTCPNCGAVL